MAVHDRVNILSVMSKLLYFLLIFCHCTDGWIHHLKLQKDDRNSIRLTRTFGFLKDGTVAVNVTVFSYETVTGSMKNVSETTFGFTLDRSKGAGLNSYLDQNKLCVFNRTVKDEKKDSVFFEFDLKNRQLVVKRYGSLINMTVVNTELYEYLYLHNLAHGKNPQTAEKDTAQTEVKTTDAKAETPSKQNKAHNGTNEQSQDEADKQTQAQGQDKNDKQAEEQSQDKASKTSETDESSSRKKRSPVETKKTKTEKAGTETGKTEKTETGKKTEVVDKKKVKTTKKPTQPKTTEPPKTLYFPMKVVPNTQPIVYQAYFLVHIKEAEEGHYNLFFHNCRKADKYMNLISFTVDIVQDNNGNYLSADEMPVPAMYFIFSVVFFIMTLIWFSVLRKADEGVYKIHYLMLVVVFFKSLSCLFHGINMHMIQLYGIHVEAWAILWYIVYLIRGALMLVTVLLIGAGWAFIKHVFTDREKKLFLIIIPLQILMNVAWVIVEESEEGYAMYSTFYKIFMGVDLLCCFAILFPVIWSIRHLQEASQTDGKAAINLNKLKLFRHFYIMVVAYIYFTRIIGYLLLITLPFRYGWMKDLFTEVFLLGFFSLTGYKFQPTSDNPYLQVPLDSDDEEEIEMDEVVTKTGSTNAVVRVNQGRGDGGKSTTSMKQRESSHEYD